MVWISDYEREENESKRDGKGFIAGIFIVLFLMLSLFMFWLGRQTMKHDLQPKIERLEQLELGDCTKSCLQGVGFERDLRLELLRLENLQK